MQPLSKTFVGRASLGQWRSGYSIPELLVVMTILGGLFFLGSDTLFAPQRTTISDTTVDTLVAEISNQQNKSMSGAIETGTVQSNYGIYFTQTSYTTFRGASYSAGNGTNFTTNLHTNLRFSTINLPSSQIIFATASGAIQGYSGSQNTVVIQDSLGSITKTLRFNQHGVVESVQ
mgnify:CR=1 FL=1